MAPAEDFRNRNCSAAVEMMSRDRVPDSIWWQQGCVHQVTHAHAEKRVSAIKPSKLLRHTALSTEQHNLPLAERSKAAAAGATDSVTAAVSESPASLEDADFAAAAVHSRSPYTDSFPLPA